MNSKPTGRRFISQLSMLLLLCALSRALYGQDEQGLKNTPAHAADQQPGYDATVTVPQPAVPAGAVLLDRVVAVINSDVILESDVLEEIRFAQFEPFEVRIAGTSEAQQALDHLINRTLILQQLKELQNAPNIADAEVNAQISEVRKHIPSCAANKCQTDAEWHAVLARQGFSEDQFRQRWRVRMLVLSFIEQRFRAGVRISKPEIQDYYEKTLVPQFRKRNVAPPPLSVVSQRVDEILLQQRVNGLLSEWLNSLKDQGTVAILDPEYKQVAEKQSSPDDPNADIEGAQE